MSDTPSDRHKRDRDWLVFETREEARGRCAFSGLTIRRCWQTDLCDCAWAEPPVCRQCATAVWDLDEHVFVMHRHHLTLYRAMQLGYWARCSCSDWHSNTYTTVTGAHLAFGKHLLAERIPR